MAKNAASNTGFQKSQCNVMQDCVLFFSDNTEETKQNSISLLQVNTNFSHLGNKCNWAASWGNQNF